MPAKLLPQERLKLLKRVLNGDSASVVCRKAGISRTLLYRWLKRFEQHKKIATLAPKKPKIASNGHVSQDNLKAILAVVKSNPMLSVARIVAKLPKDAKEKPLVGHHGVQNVLARLNLNTIKKRKAFQKASFDRPVSIPVQAMPVGMQADAIGLPNRALRPQDRLTMIERVQAGEPVSKVCEEYGVSRTIFYRWLKRYEEAMEGQKLDALWDKKPKVMKYFNQALQQYENAVLSAIAQYPELSTHKLVEVLPRVGGRPILGNHGVQNVLRRYNLNTYEKRLAYAKSQVHAFGFEPGVGALERIVAYLLGQTPAFRTFLVRASFTLAFSVFVGVTIYGAAAFLRILTSTPSITFSIGMLFSLVALICGMFFFIYSLKYYFTIAVVLSFSRRKEEGEKEKNASLLQALFGYSQASHVQQSREEVERGGGLLTDISHIALSRKPFISIQLATYNEKRVVDRLLTAATAMDYENYEVIIVDDSTDETVGILNRWKDHPRVKVIHRPSREGFKGGALREALRASSPQTEFILIFDADFIPYPDTITHFLKYFQHLANGLSPASLAQSNIAAVQGYQWHVLNKSENWITRGVRSEYAGSYVIERSGAEIYGGIKQIAGSVYMIRADMLKKVGWGTSITEDFELTLKLYEKGYKVAYTPYIQAPAEAVATIKRLIRQRMRWAEGHSNNIKKMFFRLLRSPKLTLTEKFELAYLSPYYLQAFFFMIGTASWFIAEVILRVTLPFWAEVWGWSLVFTNMLALPLMNMVGLFLEESEEKDYLGLLSFVALSYIVAPFQAYAAVRGFVGDEGPWFRTPKTGRITDTFTPGKFYRYLRGFFGQHVPAAATTSAGAYMNSDQLGSTIRSNSYVALATANNTFQRFHIKRKNIRWVGNVALALLVITTLLLINLAPLIPQRNGQRPFALASTASAKEKDTSQGKEQIEKITTPRQIRFETPSGESLEMIFHKEPRVRIKLGQKELEITTLELKGIGSVRPQRSYFVGKREVWYEEIVPGVDLVYKLHRRGFSEEFVIKKPMPALTGVLQRVVAKKVNIVSPNPSTFGFFDENNKEVFDIGSAFLFEKSARDNKQKDVKMTLVRGVEGYDFEKTIGQAARAWLLDPARSYPVILDPPVTILGSGYVNGDAEYGGNQRKIVFMSLRDRYYTVGNDAASIQLWISNDNVGSGWTQLSDLDDDNDDHDPTMVVDGDNFWVAFNDNSSDNPQFMRITTTSSSETVEAVCTGPDMGAVAAADVNAFAVGSTLLYFGSDNDPDLYKITKSEYVPTPSNCSSADFTSITDTTDGPTAGSRPVFQVTTSDELQVVWRTTSGLRHGIYSGSGWNASAPFTVNSFDSTSFSMVKDASNNLYVIAESAAGAANVYKCSATCTGTWSDLGTAILDTDCASGYTDILYTSLTYDSTNDDLISFIVASDATNERACFRKSSDMGSTWEATTWNLGWTSTDLGHISSTDTVSNPNKAAVTIRDAATYSFATVPEKSLFLLFSLPFLSAIFERFKKRKL